MRKGIKTTIKYATGILLLLIVVLMGGVCYLYFSADMLTPAYTPTASAEKVLRTDSPPAIWRQLSAPQPKRFMGTEDKRECLSKRRSDRQTIARPALLSGESLCRPDTRNHSFGKLP